MTLIYCDFCGKQLGYESDPGDPVTLGNPESIPDAKKDACSECFGKLWKMVQSRPGQVPSQVEADSRMAGDLMEIRNWLSGGTPYRLFTKLDDYIIKLRGGR